MAATRTLLAALVATLATLATATAAPALAKEAAPGYHIVDRVALPDGWWDGAVIEPVNRQLFVARGNGVFKLDLDNGLYDYRFIPGLEGRTVTPIGDGGMMLTTFSGYSAVILFSTVEGKVAKVFWMSQPADGAVYDPVSKLAWVIGAHGRISAVDPVKLEIATVTELDETLGSATTDGKGTIYFVSTNSNSVIAFDTTARKVSGTWPLKDCVMPSAIAYAAEANVLLPVCFNNLLKVIDARDGRELASLPVGKGSEAVIYDEATKRVFVPGPYEGVLSVFRINGPRDVRKLEDVPTQIGTRTGAIDSRTGTLYLPTGRMGPINKLGWPEPLPGTVELLVMKPG